MSEDKIYQPHDKFFIKSMSDPKVARVFFESYLPDEIKEIANLDTLTPKRDTYVDEYLKKHVTDMVYEVEMNGRPGYFYVLVEHMRTSDPLMAFRLLFYILRIIDQHLKEQKNKGQDDKTLPLIFPIVLYNGEHQYRHTTDIFELFGENEALARKTFLMPFKLLDLNVIPDKELKDKTWASILLLCLKHVNDRGDLLSWLDILFPNIEFIAKHGGTDHITAAFVYLLTHCDSKDIQKFRHKIHKKLPPLVEENIMTIATKLEEIGVQKGMQKGRQEGIEEGIQKDKEEVTLRMLKKGTFALEEISEISGLSLVQVKALHEKHLVH